MNTYGLNQEGYPDPTATKAVAAATKAEKKYLPLVYICSKYSGDTVANTEAAKRYSRFAVDQDAIPLAPHLLLPLYLVKLAQAKKDYTVVADEVDRLKEKNQQLLVAKAETEGLKKRIAELELFLQEANDELTEYNEAMVRKYIQEIKVYGDKFQVIFKAGIELDIER